MPKRTKDEQQLKRLMFALADSIQSASDEEILAEPGLEGKDALLESEKVRDLLRSVLKQIAQQKLREARKHYATAIDDLQSRRFPLPDSPLARRHLLMGVLDRRPDVGSALLTAQHRDFTSLTDDDIRSFLEQLIALGILPDGPTKP